MAFCKAMNNFTVNEKGNISNSLEGSAKECLGMVNLWNNAIGKRGGGKGGKGGKGGGKGFGKGGVNSSCDIDENKLNDTVDFIYNNIDNLGTFQEKKKYWTYYIKLLFKIRDHKDGNGERLYFYKLFLRLHERIPSVVEASLGLLTGGYNSNMELENDKPFGGFVDLNKLYDLCEEKHKNLKTAIVNYYIKCMIKDRYAVAPSLAVKWIPRENKMHDVLAKEIAVSLFADNEPLHKKMKKYRQFIKDVMDKIVIIEKLMTEGRWDEIEVKNIGSKALMKYLYAFKNEDKKTGAIRHPGDEKRMILREKILTEFSKSPEESRMNVSVLQPYEITRDIINGKLLPEQETDVIAMWSKFEYEWNKDLEEANIGEDDMDMVIMSDVSYSMTGIAMEACIALSLLFANRLKEPWKNKVLTFDSVPQWFDIPEHMNIVQKIKYLLEAPWGGSTNIGLALERMLDTAVKNKIKPEDMPSKLLILSDMQFDQACQHGDEFLTGYEFIESKYKRYKLPMPHIIFWNLRGNTSGYVNKSDQEGTTTMSGFGASSFKAFMGGKFNIENTPWDTLKDMLESERLRKLDRILNTYLCNINIR